jgi:hypothetical protein
VAGAGQADHRSDGCCGGRSWGWARWRPELGRTTAGVMVIMAAEGGAGRGGGRRWGWPGRRSELGLVVVAAGAGQADGRKP